ncbi:hypothetical protein [Streptomyces sp. NPDC047070]|uniref:hypothetical protein n=1 Tax=Streptomyces sp. NPDC047070 TaxID=3154923 RepID=UPI00345214DD
MTTSTTTAADAEGGILPPYSGDDPLCPKCADTQAHTDYRPAIDTRRIAAEWNGKIVLRGPLPERLERTCTRCSYQWVETLCPPGPGMTVEALAHALDNSTPYPVDLDAEVRTVMARYLLDCLVVSARPDHPLWQYDAGQPPETVQPTPAEECPAAPAGLAVCEFLHRTREEEDACEQRRAPQLPSVQPETNDGDR